MKTIAAFLFGVMVGVMIAIILAVLTFETDTMQVIDRAIADRLERKLMRDDS